MTNSHAHEKINELNEEIVIEKVFQWKIFIDNKNFFFLKQKSQIFIENLLVEQNKELTKKIEEISNLNQRIEAFVMKLVCF